MKYFGILASSASGSIRGVTASHNRGGQYFRGRAIPSNPNTAQQQAVRSAMAVLSPRWGSLLTADQRAAWDAYAAATPITNALGSAINVGGLGMYIRGNVPRINAGDAIIDDAPTVYNVGEFTPPTFAAPDASAGTVSVAFEDSDEWASEVGSFMYIYASAPQSPSINYFKGPYRLAGKIVGASSPPSSPQLITLPFPVAVSQKVFFKANVSRLDGRYSADFRASGTVVA